MVKKLKSPRRLAALAVFAIVAMSAFGFAAANVVPATTVGDGTGTVSGVTVTNVDYNMNGTNAGNIDSVSMTVAAALGATVNAKIQLVAGGAWYSCTVGGTSIQCNTTSPQATALATDQLRLVVTD